MSYNKNGNPIYTILGNNGQRAIFTYDQALAKYYHADVYNLEFPKEFDVDHAHGLKPKDRIAYIEKTVPPEKIMEFLKANVESFIMGDFIPVPGSIGSRKDPGRLYINKNTGQIHFFNDRTDVWRTTIRENKKGIE